MPSGGPWTRAMPSPASTTVPTLTAAVSAPNCSIWALRIAAISSGLTAIRSPSPPRGGPERPYLRRVLLVVEVGPAGDPLHGRDLELGGHDLVAKRGEEVDKVLVGLGHAFEDLV